LALTSEVKTGLVTAAATLAVGLLTLNQALVGVFYDDGLYAGLAIALGSAHGYVHPNLPGMPAAVHYPPLYPIVLAPLFGALSVQAAAIAGKVLNALLNAGAAGLIAWHAAKSQLLGPSPRTSIWVAGAVVVAAAIAIPVLATQSVLFAEPLFGALLAVAVVAADRSTRPWLAGVAAALALLTRSIGIAIVAGILCFLLLHRAPRRVAIAVALPGVIAALVWGLWVVTHAHQIDPALALNYGTYLSPVAQAGLSTVAVNIRDLPRPLEVLAFGWIPVFWLYSILAITALAIGLYGLWVVSRRSSIGLVLVFYVLILAIWPYPPDRFLWAVLPWLALVWCAGAFELVSRWPRLRIPLAAFALVAAGGYSYFEYRGVKARGWDSQAHAISANFAELLPVVRNLPDSAVLATDDEALVWLYSRRVSVPLYLESYRGRELIRPTPAEHRAYLERMGVTHVLLASATSPSAIELRGLIGAYPAMFTAIYRWPDGRWLFAVSRGQ
jgi:hypothetical protein